MYDIHNKKNLMKAINNYNHFYNNQRYQSRFDSKIPIKIKKEGIDKINQKCCSIVTNSRIEKYKELLKI